MSAAPPVPPPNQSPTAWPRSAQLTLAFFLGISVTIVLGRFTPLFSRPTPTVLTAGVDVNTASKAELLQLPQVGEKRADAILAARDRLGSFKSTDDLRAAKGIGPVRQEALRPHVKISADEQFISPTNVPAERSIPAPSRGKKGELHEPIDVNSASAEELQRLPGIGPVMAGRIITERDKRPFESPEDLRRVSGIGPKTLEKLRPFVKFSSDQ
jgi:competence protein ComEA